MSEREWRKQLRRNPQSVDARLRLSVALVRKGRFVDAEKLLAIGVAISPRDTRLLYQHGESLLDIDRVDDAIERFRAVLELQPGDPEVLASLGGALLRIEESAEAVELLQQAAAGLPDDPVVFELLGEALAISRRVAEARDAYLRAWELGRRTPSIAFYCGNALSDAGHFAHAVHLMEAGVALGGEETPPWHNLGKARFELGDVTAANAAFRRSLEHGELTSLRNLAVGIPGDPRADHDAVRRVREQYAERVALDAGSWSPSPRTGGTVRIAYVSSFFANPNYMKPVYAVLAAHDAGRVDVELFHDGPHSEELGRCVADSAVSSVHEVGDLSNEALVQLIRSRELDVLIDLNAYSAMRRLPIYTTRLARHGVGWFNHYATSGLPALDLLIGDAQTISPEELDFYSERVELLPLSYLAFRVEHPTPEVTPAPCVSRGHLTFGSLCSQYKLTPDVLAGWGRILSSVPESRLILANRTVATPDVAEYVLRLLRRSGVSSDRIELRGGAPHQEYLRNYDDIDIALDAWPYNGGTTTTEAMWQGVPVLCFRGDRWASRTSASLVADSPFAEFLRDSEESMLAFAEELGRRETTPNVLTELRATARAQLLASPVCDVTRLTRELERIYESLATNSD